MGAADNGESRDATRRLAARSEVIWIRSLSPLIGPGQLPGCLRRRQVTHQTSAETSFTPPPARALPASAAIAPPSRPSAAVAR